MGGGRGRLQRASKGGPGKQRAAENVARRATGETKERLKGGPGVFKL
jgi:hypothetical protein